MTEALPALLPGGVGLIVACVIMTAMPIAWTTMRVWSQEQKHLPLLRKEDVLCYMALLFNTGSNINYILIVVLGGMPHHFGTLTATQVVHYEKIVLAAQILYALTLGCAKLSIICMLKRIFGISRTFSWTAWALMAMTCAWTLQTILIALLLCRPVSMTWDSSVKGTCGNSVMAYTSVSAVDLVTDTCILALPMKLVFSLRINIGHKIALAGIFGFGVITMIFTAIRLYFVYNLDPDDITYSSLSSTIIGVVQLGIAIMVTSSPLLRPVFDRTFGAWFSLSSIHSKHRKNEYDAEGIGGDHPITVGRLRQRERFRGPINDSEENLQWELTAMGRQGWEREVTVQGARSSEESDAAKKIGEIMVTKSTTVL